MNRARLPVPPPRHRRHFTSTFALTQLRLNNHQTIKPPILSFRLVRRTAMKGGLSEAHGEIPCSSAKSFQDVLIDIIKSSFLIPIQPIQPLFQKFVF